MNLKRMLLHKNIKAISPNTDVELAEKLLNFITSEIIEWTKESKSNLILNIKGFGRFFWRKSKLITLIEKRKDFCDENNDNAVFIDKAKNILEKYKKWEEEKQNVRKLNYKENYKTSEELAILKLEKLNKLK